MTSKQICEKGIPLSVVTLNRAVIVISVLLGLTLHQPLLIVPIFVVLVFALLLGPRGSLVYQIGVRVFAQPTDESGYEDCRLMRFNNTLAVLMLGAALVAFVFGQSVIGWLLAATVAIVATVALAGFCVGCFLYFQFRLQRSRLFGG